MVELSLTQLAIWDNAHLRVYGVGQAELHFAPDSSDPAWVWPYVTMLCFGDEPMGIRYRITLYRPKPDTARA